MTPLFVEPGYFTFFLNTKVYICVVLNYQSVYYSQKKLWLRFQLVKLFIYYPNFLQLKSERSFEFELF